MNPESETLPPADAASNSSKLYQIIYTSTARRELAAEELLSLLRGSRIRNAVAGITGLLLYHDGRLMQILEGTEKNVRKLFEKIEGDQRHRGLFIVWEGAISTRQFTDHSMALHDPTELESHYPGLSHHLLEKCEHGRQNLSTPADHFIRVFRIVAGIDHVRRS